MGNLAGKIIATLHPKGNFQKNKAVLVSDQGQFWIKCRSARPNQTLPIGLCERLKANCAKVAGHGANTNGAGPYGLVVILG